MISNNFVVHMGYPISGMIYEHNIPITEWNKILSNVEKQREFKLTENKKTYRILHLYGLIYECSDDGDILCYSDTIDNINYIKSDNALTYNRHRKFYDYEFQPTNQYYNTFNVIRSTYKNDDMSILFEEKCTIHEVKIIYNESCSLKTLHKFIF